MASSRGSGSEAGGGGGGGEPQLNLSFSMHVGAILLLEVLGLLFTITTVTSTYYFKWDLTLTVPTRETQTTYYSPYQTCTTSTLYSDHVQEAARGICGAVFFTELFLALAALANLVALLLYLVSGPETTLPSGQRAWRLLTKGHAACAVCLLLALGTASGLFRDLGTVLGRNLTSVQEGRLRFSYGFAWHILAILAHALAVGVLITSSSADVPTAMGASDADRQQLQQQGLQEEPRISAESSPPPSAAKGKALKEPLLSLEEGSG